MSNQDQAVNILVDAPKDFTVNSVVKFTQALNGQVDIGATLIQKIEQDNFNKISYLETLTQHSGSGAH